MITNNNVLVFLALMRRDLKVIFSNLKSILIDSVIMSLLFSLLFGGLLPALGMSSKLSGPLFLGSGVLSMISQGFSRAVRIKYDIEFGGFIDYQFTLPISKMWLFAQYITAFSLEILISALPTFFMGLLILSKFIPFQISLIPLLMMFLITSWLFSIFFLFLAFFTQWQWFISNTWERLLGPLMHLGGLYFIWSRLNSASDLLGNITLLNPLTFVNEGLRASLFGKSEYLPILLCIIVLISWTALMLIPFWYAINKRMDMVK